MCHRHLCSLLLNKNILLRRWGAWLQHNTCWLRFIPLLKWIIVKNYIIIQIFMFFMWIYCIGCIRQGLALEPKNIEIFPALMGKKTTVPHLRKFALPFKSSWIFKRFCWHRTFISRERMSRLFHFQKKKWVLSKISHLCYHLFL